MSMIGNSPGVASQRVVSPFTATSGQTTFTPISGYTLGYCDVFLNGIKLANGDDYTASNGTTVVLAVGAALGDFVEVVAYFPRGLSDGYLKSEADAKFVGLTGAQTIAGNKTFTGAITTIGSTSAAGIETQIGAAYPRANNWGNSGLGNPSWENYVYDNQATTSGKEVSYDMVRLSGDTATGMREFYTKSGTSWINTLRLKNGDVTLPSGNLVLASGKGIDFSATGNGAGSMTGELLNDYEEGTWTPTLGGNATYQIREGIYTKIGRQVTIRFDVMVTTLGTGDVRTLSGLPYAVAGANYYGAAASYWVNINAVNVTSIIIVGTSGMYFETTTASTTNTPNDNVAIWGNGVRVLMTATYFTN